MSPWWITAGVVGWALAAAGAAPFVGRTIRAGREHRTPPVVLPQPAEPGDDEGWAGGALLRLAQSTDQTSARYWLAMYARRGATWEQQRDAWEQWQQMHDSSVTYLHTYREEPRP